MKKTTKLLLGMALITAFLSGCSTKETIVNPDGGTNTPASLTDGTFVFEGNKVRALNTDISGDLVIPETFNGVTINEIPSRAFKDCTGITSIVIPNTIKTIGEGAFNGCSRIGSITVPFVGNTSTATGTKGVFGYIFGKTSYAGGTSVSQYYTDAMANRYTAYLPATLTSVTVTNAVQLSDGAFDECSQLETINLNDGIVGIGHYSFQNCTSIKELSFPSVTELPYYAFENCSSLEKITVGNSLRTLGVCVFKDCINLKKINSDVDGEINLPSGVKTITGSCFSGCIRFKKMSLPFVGETASLSTPSKCCFGYIFGTKEHNGMVATYQRYGSGYGQSDTYYLPAGLEEITITNANGINYGAFMNVSMITSLKINESAKASVGEYAFENCVEPVWF